MHTSHILGLNLKTAFNNVSAYREWARKNRVPFRLAVFPAVSRMNQVIENWEKMNMASKRRSQNQAWNMTWVRVDLNEGEKLDFKSWYNDSSADFGKLIEMVLSAGDKMTFSYNETQDSFYCTIMGTDKSVRNSGKGFSSWAKDPLLALGLSLYKYHQVLSGDFSEVPSSDDADFG